MRARTGLVARVGSARTGLVARVGSARTGLVAQVGLLVVALGLAGGCATWRGGVERPLAPDDPRPQALLVEQGRQGGARRTVRATARVSLDGARGASFARQLVLLARPASLRVEVLGLLGQRIAVLATDGASYDLYRAEDRAFEQGAVHPDVLWEVAGVPLTPGDAVRILLGDPPLPAAPPERSVALDDSADGAVRLEWAGDAFLLEFDAEGRVARYRVRDADGAVRVEARYDDYRLLDEVLLAHHIALDFPSSGARAEIELKEVELNPVLPPELFRLPPPRRVSSRRGDLPR